MYQFLPPNEHLDFGFRITSETYYNSALLLNSQKKNIQAFQLVEMPISFLYRHAIELALKSLIIIFHKKLEIPYDKEPFDSISPKIFSQGKWRPLYSCHWIDELYKYWKDELLLKNLDKIKQLAPKGDWSEYSEITKAIPIISHYDRKSSFFRYPVTENEALDLEKFTMKEIDVDNLFELLNSEKKPQTKKTGATVVFGIKDQNDNIVKAYKKQDELLTELTESLIKVAEYFNGIHIMTRMTLCNGQ
jgi:hypothetical protein